jgi:hypothetical protein
MKATLYQPNLQPQAVSPEGLVLPDESTGFAIVPAIVATLLDCASELVDVLACGASYVVYTVFDSEEEANLVATQAVATLTGIDFDITDEDELLRGPVLIIKE